MIQFHRLSIRVRGRNRYERLLGVWRWVAALAGCAFLATLIAASPTTRGDFEGESDIGGPLRAGSVTYDPSRGEYRITGGGANMWNQTDAFHFLWRRASGDLTLTANVRFPHPGGNEHRKAGWMVRQGLGPSAPYADLVVHGSGLTSLQYRLTEGGTTQEIESKISMPETIRLVRLGKTFLLWASRAGGQLELAGSVEVPLDDPLYVGLAVCAHDAEALEEAVFSNLSIVGGKPEEERDQAVESRLEVIAVDGGERRIVYHAEKRFEAPNWSRDGKFLLFNSGGRIYTLPLEGGEPRPPGYGGGDSLQQRSWVLTGRHVARDQQFARREFTDLCAPGQRREAAAGDGARTVLLAWLVSGWQDAGVLRGAGRQLRCLHDSRRGRRGTAADGCAGPGRRSGLFAGWPIHLLQLGAHGLDADLAHEARWNRPGASDPRRLRQLVCSPFTRWEVAGVHFFRQARERTPAQQGRHAASHAHGGR